MRSLLICLCLAMAVWVVPIALPPAAAEAPRRATVGELPATLEGDLVIEVREDEMTQEGGSEDNFGTLTTADGEVAFQVSSTLLREAGIPAEGARVRATLGSVDEEMGFPLYTITALSRLP